MAEEEKNEQTEENEGTAAEEPKADEAPAEEETPAEEEAPAEAETPAEEEAPAAAAPAADGDDEEQAAPTQKQLRKQRRAQASGPAKPQRTSEERIAERDVARQSNAAKRRRYRTAHRQRDGEPATGTPPAERGAGPKKVRTGKVVSTKAEKTITVQIEVTRRHSTYEKVVRRSATLHAHDESSQAQEGDTVRVVETRPLSRTKRWRLVEVLERAR